MRNTLSEEESQRNREMDIESMAKIVFRNLKKKPNTYLDGSNFSPYVDDLGSTLFPKENYRLSYPDRAKVLEAIALLERRGLVVRNVPEDSRGGHKDQFVVYLTSIGIKSNIDDGVILLIDRAEEIVDALEQDIGDLDPVVHTISRVCALSKRGYTFRL